MNDFKNSITYKLFLEKNKITKLNNLQRINYFNSKNIVNKMFSKSTNSDYVLLLNNYIIVKCLKKNMHGYTLWKNEVNTLLKLENIIFFPDIIAADPNNLIIYMSYCGKTLSKNPKIPKNWKNQLKKIKKILLVKGINPNDITVDNVCVLDGIIKIIDFGLANNSYNEINKSIDKLYKLISEIYYSRVYMI